MSGIPAGAGSLLGKRLGKYEIVALLALGGTAEIYLARIGGTAGFEKYVVVKCLHDHLADDAEFVKMFLDEARLAAHLDHSNIVQTMELGEHESRYYMVMEFLAGLSLAMIVRRAAERLPGGRVPVPLVLNMVAQSCAGLHYAHGRVMNGKPLNIVHRDISPQNLVVSFEGVVKVVDFGIAKAELRETRTRSGTIKGKFAYMSPEQCVANNVDRRTDVFALGVIAHELLTGRRLFKKGSAYETYQAVLECAVEPPSHVDAAIDPVLDEIVMRAVAKEKEQRYPTAEAFGDAILGYLHHRGQGSGPGDVSRFFEASFGQEIEEHGARMRELISGREYASEVANWGVEDEDGKQIVDIADAMGAKPMLGNEENLPPDVIGGIDSATGDLGDVGGDDDDLPAERTRIEANPLERLNELEAEVARTRAKQAGQTPPAAQPVVPQPAPERPDPAMVPTMIGEPDKSGSIAARAAVDVNARTALNLTPPPMLVNGAPSGPPVMPPDAQSTESPAARASDPTMMAPDENDFDETVAQSPSMLAGLDAGRSGSGLPRQPLPPSEAPRVAHGPLDEPSFLEQLDTVLVPPSQVPLQHVATHASSQPTSLDLGPPPQRLQQMQQQAHDQMQQAHEPGVPGSGPHEPGVPGSGPQMMQPGQGMTGMMGPGGRPANLPSGYPVMNAQLREQMTSGATVFPSDVVSPVGPGYQDVDWEAAAAAPARAMPAWKLAIVFIGTLGIALLITILIAQAVR